MPHTDPRRHGTVSAPSSPERLHRPETIRSSFCPRCATPPSPRVPFLHIFGRNTGGTFRGGFASPSPPRTTDSSLPSFGGEASERCFHLRWGGENIFARRLGEDRGPVNSTPWTASALGRRRKPCGLLCAQRSPLLLSLEVRPLPVSILRLTLKGRGTRWS